MYTKYVYLIRRTLREEAVAAPPAPPARNWFFSLRNISFFVIYMHFCDLICVIIINEKKSIKVYYEHKRIKIEQKTKMKNELFF